MRQIERPQHSQHPSLAEADTPVLLHPQAQIDDAPPRDFVHRRIGTGQYHRFQCRHLPFAQLRPASRRWPIAQPGNPFRVVAVNPVSQGAAPTGAARGRWSHQRSADRDCQRSQGHGSGKRRAAGRDGPPDPKQTLWVPLPRPQHLLLAKRFRCNSFGESASTQVGISPAVRCCAIRQPPDAQGHSGCARLVSQRSEHGPPHWRYSLITTRRIVALPRMVDRSGAA